MPLGEAERLDKIMTVILVLATFSVFILLDYLMNRGKAMRTVPVAATNPVPAEFGGDMVEG